jgi:hypothetical protein
MAERTLNFLIAASKQGHSLSQISQLTKLTEDQVKERLGQVTGLTVDDLALIFSMKQEGYSLDQISQEYGVELQVLEQFLPQPTTPVIKETVITQIKALIHQGKGPPEIARILGINERAVLAYALDGESKTYFSKASDPAPIHFRPPPTPTEETKQPQATKPEPQHTPTFLYSCQDRTSRLIRVNLLTGEESWHMVHYLFEQYCRWSELPGGSLLITGGGRRRGEVRDGSSPAVSDVVKIDTSREYAVCSQPPMHTPRYSHAALYHSQYVYVLGGDNGDWWLSECERYSCAQSRWEVLLGLPVTGRNMSSVEVENSLYALGGYDGYSDIDTVQKLSLDTLTWQLMQLKLPRAASFFPCFKTDTEVYLVINRTLHSFTPLQVTAVKTLDDNIECRSSYYSRGTLYYEDGSGYLFSSEL